jgi:hypothetical protein
MKKFILLFISFIMAWSCFAIEPTRHLTKEDIASYNERLERTEAVSFKIQNKSNEDKSVFIFLIKNKNGNQQIEYEEAYEYIIPANSTEEIVFTGKYNPKKNSYYFGWYCEEYGFGHGGLNWWAKSKPIFDKDGMLTYEEKGSRKSMNVTPTLLE